MTKDNVDYTNISLIKVADCSDLGSTKPKFMLQIYFLNGSALFGEIREEHWEENVFDARQGRISSHWDTDFMYTTGGAETKFEIAEVDRLLNFCDDITFEIGYNTEDKVITLI